MQITNQQEYHEALILIESLLSKGVMELTGADKKQLNDISAAIDTYNRLNLRPVMTRAEVIANTSL